MSKEKKEGEFSLKGRAIKPKNLSKNSSNEPIKVKVPKVEEPSSSADVTKVFIKNEDNADKKQEAADVVADKSTQDIQEVGEQVSQLETSVQDEVSVIEEIIEEEVAVITKEVIAAKQEEIQTGRKLPENIEKLVDFMEDTGGTVEDYVRLNADYTNIDETQLLKEYYKKTKPYLDSEDMDIILEDYDYDEDIDEDRDIRKKKIAFKEEVNKARNFLEETKSKYYDEIKLRPGVTQDQQKATDFFSRYNEEQEVNNAKQERFRDATKNVFNEEFKGFDFNVGEKKFRYGVKNPSSVAEEQSDIGNFIGKFLNKEGEISDHKGYHKALYAAKNADTIAQHFYEQGKADSVKAVIAKSKNITTESRKTSTSSEFVNGWKVKAVNSGSDSSKLSIKKNKFN
jgi:hypothetical protein